MKTKFNKYAALICALCTVMLVFSGCSELFDPLPQTAAKEGVGLVRLSINSSNGRTIMPQDVTFFRYIARVYEADLDDPDQRIPIILSNNLDSMEVTVNDHLELPYGQYDIEILAYVDEFDDHPAATGTAFDVVVVRDPSEATQTAIIDLVPSQTDGVHGIFVWDLTFDASITQATMHLIRLTEDGEDPRAPIALHPFTGNKATGSRDDLDAGVYRVVFTLGDGTNTVEWTEALHIYDYMYSRFVYTFENLFTITLEQKIKEMITAGDLTDVYEGHFAHMGINIAGVSSSLASYNLFLGKLIDYGVINNSLRTTVDAALVFFGNYAHPFTNEYALKNYIKGLPENGTIIEDADIVITLGTPNTAVVTIAGQGVDIEGFTYDPPGSTKTLVSIEITTPPTDLVYFIDDVMDPDGLVVTANYDIDGTVTPEVLTAGAYHITPTNYHLTEAGSKVFTVSFTDEAGTTKEATFTVTVNKHPALASTDFGAHTIAQLNQNILNIVPVSITLNPEHSGKALQIGNISVYYLAKTEPATEFVDADKGTYTLPTTLGSFDVYFEVAEGTHYLATAVSKISSTLVIAPAEIHTTYFNISDEFTQVEIADVGSKAVAVTWKAENLDVAKMGLTGSTGIEVKYEDPDGTLNDAFPTTLSADNESYHVVLVLAATDYFPLQNFTLFSFRVVPVYVPEGEAGITITNADFTDKAPDITGGQVSVTGAKNAPTSIPITVTGTYYAIEWYLDGVKDNTNNTNEYIFTSAGKTLGVIYYVTVRVQPTAGGSWYSRTIEIKIVP